MNDWDFFKLEWDIPGLYQFLDLLNRSKTSSFDKVEVGVGIDFNILILFTCKGRSFILREGDYVAIKENEMLFIKGEKNGKKNNL